MTLIGIYYFKKHMSFKFDGNLRFKFEIGDGDVMSLFVGLRGMFYYLFYVSFTMKRLLIAIGSLQCTVTRWARGYSRGNTSNRFDFAILLV